MATMKWPFAPTSKKVLTQALFNVLGALAGYVVARQGLNVDPAVSAEFAGASAVVAGLGAGWLAKEIPGLVGAEASAPPAPLTPADFGARPPGPPV